MTDRVIELGKAIEQVRVAYGIDELSFYPHCIDIQLIHLLNEMLLKKLVLTVEHASLLIDKLSYFVNSLGEKQEYSIPYAGTYKLQYQYSVMYDLIQVCKCKPKK